MAAGDGGQGNESAAQNLLSHGVKSSTEVLHRPKKRPDNSDTNPTEKL